MKTQLYHLFFLLLIPFFSLQAEDELELCVQDTSSYSQEFIDTIDLEALEFLPVSDSLQLADSVPYRRLKIGSHHSLSYAKPKWYWVPFNWMVKCQSLTLEEQLDCGVIYFDIRVRFKKDKVISGHGLIDYNIDVLKELEMLDSRSTEENPIYVRIMYESKPMAKNPTVERMKEFMTQLKTDYPNLLFTQCHIRNPYTLVETVNNVPKADRYQFYKDYGAKTFGDKLKGLKFPYPKHYATENNAKYVNEICEENQDVIYIFDFVNTLSAEPEESIK